MESDSGSVGRSAGSARPERRIGGLALLLMGCGIGSAVAIACAGPAVPTPISGEPVCPDFEVGATKTKMRGGLRLPVSVIIKDGKEPVMRTTVYGMRTDKDTPTKILLPDDNDEYTVEWAQCENERAPRPADDTGSPSPKATALPRNQPAEYECGAGKVYKTDKLVTKKGDLASHALAFPAPPKTDCWQGETPAATPDAGAEPAATDAGADTQDAGTDAAAAATDAGTGDAATSAPDAGKGDAGKPPAPKPDGGTAKKAPPPAST